MMNMQYGQAVVAHEEAHRERHPAWVARRLPRHPEGAAGRGPAWATYAQLCYPDPLHGPEKKCFSKKVSPSDAGWCSYLCRRPTRGPRLNLRRPTMQRSPMSSTRTICRVAAAIGAGIAALAISVSAADIASARPNVCDPGISCPPPHQQPGNPPHPGPGTYPPYDDSAPPLFPAPQGGPTPVPFPPCTTQPGGCL